MSNDVQEVSLHGGLGLGASIESVITEARASFDSISEAAGDDVMELLMASQLGMAELLDTELLDTIRQWPPDVLLGGETASSTGVGASPDLGEFASTLVDECSRSLVHGLVRDVPRISAVRIDMSIEAQACLNWHSKGRPSQSPSEEKDDYYHAERYLSFIMMDGITRKCKGGAHCFLVMFPDTEKFFDMLRGTTVEDYVQFKAYLGWKRRSDWERERRLAWEMERDGERLPWDIRKRLAWEMEERERRLAWEMERDGKRLPWDIRKRLAWEMEMSGHPELDETRDDLGDYLTASTYLGRECACMCPTASSYTYAYLPEVARDYYVQQQQVKAAKRASYLRLCGGSRGDEGVEAKISDFVEKYARSIVDLCAGRALSPDCCRDVLRYIYRDPKIVNLFEYLTRNLFFDRMEGAAVRALRDELGLPDVDCG
jgi:hypothetical protein